MFEELSGFELVTGSREFTALYKLDQLTAGDFSNVKRRFTMLGGMDGLDGASPDVNPHLSIAGWLNELAAETRDRLVDKSRSIGFQ